MYLPFTEPERLFHNSHVIPILSQINPIHTFILYFEDALLYYYFRVWVCNEFVEAPLVSFSVAVDRRIANKIK
jgi:hypothetical protein